MPLEQYPYTNFHELNLDFILSVVKEYQKRFLKLEVDFQELHDFVMNFFDNTEFAQAVSDKIDELINNGDFTTLFAAYTTRIYDTAAAMKADNLLIDGSHARTLGYYAAGDGGGADYIITNTAPLIFYETLASGLYAAMITDAVNIMQMGAVGDGLTDNSAIINRAITEHNEIVIPDGQYASNTITLDSGKIIKVRGEIVALQTPLFDGDNLENTIIDGGLYSTSLTNGTCIDLDNCQLCEIRNARITGFKNKGITLHDSFGNTIKNTMVTGSDGTTGGGISISGTSASNNVESCWLSLSRIGLILQSSHDNNVNDVVCSNCSDMGICLDGTVSGSGDGAYQNNICNVIISGQTDNNYGGLYLGNGSNNNLVNNFQIYNCYRGIKTGGGASYAPAMNRFTNGSVHDCTAAGIELTYGLHTFIDNVIIDNCVTGVDFYYADYSQVSNCTIINNTSRGIKIQAGYCTVIANRIIGNSKGVLMAYGGSSPVNNAMFNNTFDNNTEDADLSGSPTVANNVNYTP